MGSRGVGRGSEEAELRSQLPVPVSSVVTFVVVPRTDAETVAARRPRPTGANTTLTLNMPPTGITTGSPAEGVTANSLMCGPETVIAEIVCGELDTFVYVNTCAMLGV